MTKDRLNLVAPCGIDCGVCELYMCKDSPQLYDYLLTRGIPKEKLPCKGCRPSEGGCPVIGNSCATYSCVQLKGVEFCHECDDFPCNKLHPASDRADVLPHNTKVFNLCTIESIGLDSFVKRSADIKQRYYKGKMEVGNGPQLL